MTTTSKTKTKEELTLTLAQKTHNSTNIITKASCIEDEDETLYSYAMQLINGASLPMVMKASIELGVLQLINDHGHTNNGLSAIEIAQRIQIRNNPDAPSMLDRMLRLLATYSVVDCTVHHGEGGVVERRYSSSRVTKFLVPDDQGVSSLAHMLTLLSDKCFQASWGKLKDAVLEGGIPFTMAHGMHSFEYAIGDPSLNEVFNKAMCHTTTFIMKKIIKKYKGFESINQLVDVGGGFGHSLHVITSQYPLIQGINFDLPHVIHKAPLYPGVEHVSGDMFESVPKGEAILLKWILHDWTDEHCLKLLKNCNKALPDNGKVIVVESTIKDEVENTHSARAASHSDIIMLTQTPGGKERTRQEFEVLAKGAGFNNVIFDCFVYNFWVIELHK